MLIVFDSVCIVFNLLLQNGVDNQYCFVAVCCCLVTFISWRNIVVTGFFDGNFINANIRYFIVY